MLWQAIGAFLLKLQVHKSLGDLQAGSAMFNKYSEVDAEWATIREVVMARKEPRKLLVQPHLHATPDGKVVLAQFEPSPAGLVESFVARYPAEDAELLALARAEYKAHGGL